MVRIFLMACALSLIAVPASAWMSLVRQGADSTEVPEANDRFGRTVVSGDFDGDGFDDLAMAAPDESNGLINTAVHGMVVISRGSPRGITTTNVRTINVGDLGTEAVRFGRSMVAADFDQDGYDDLAVGIPELDSMTGIDYGAVWIYSGSASGLQLAPYRQIFLEDVENFPVDDANFGWSLTAGDFDDDGYPDIAAGAIGQLDDTGTVYFFFGSQQGIVLDGFQRLFPLTVGGAETARGRFGWALAAGQYDGQPGDDLAIGAPETTVGGVGNAGRVYVYSSNGTTGISPSSGWFLDGSNMSEPTTGGARLGFSLAAGHFFQTSGQQDLAIGAPENDYGDQNNAGAVFVVEFETQPNTYDSIRVLRQSNFQSTDATLAEPNDGFGWAVAAGDFDNDGYDDVGIGAPFEDLTEQGVLGEKSNAGVCHVVYGRDGGPWVYNEYVDTFDSVDLNNFIDFGVNLGYSLCFGNFDDSGRANLAVGAPGADYDSYESGGSDVQDAGQVHVVAPWRQPQGHPHRSSVALDCDGFIVYGQRIFQRVRPASTTKALTLLLACEAIANGEIDRDLEGTVPGWIAGQVGGSQTPLIKDEIISFDGLMKTMMTVSGNDSAMLIGAILSGEGNSWQGWSGTSPSFGAAMETRAHQLGLSSAVSMTNAAGIDSGDHYVTALDWASLSWLLIRNECVREIVNTSPWEVERDLPDGTFNQFLGTDSELDQFTTTFYAGWVDGVKGQYSGAVGMKPGGTPGGWRTGISAGNPPGPTPGYQAASSFGTRRDDEPVEGVDGGCSTCLHGDLLRLAGTYCEGAADDFAPGPPPPPRPWGTLTGIPACSSEPGRSMTISPGAEQVLEPSGPMQIDVFRSTFVAPQVTMRQVVERTFRAKLTADEVVSFGGSPTGDNLGLEVTNAGTGLARFRVSWNGVGTDVVLEPDSTVTLPGILDGGRIPTPSITTVAPGELVLDVHEVGYLYEHVLGDGATAPDNASVLLQRGGRMLDETVTVWMRGQDETCGDDELDLVARDAQVISTDVGDLPLRPAPARVRMLPNVPNPFNPVTSVRFDLPVAAAVDLKIFDVRGRQVKTLASGTSFVAGRHSVSWDGTDDSGRAVASGVYYSVLTAAGASARQKMLLMK